MLIGRLVYMNITRPDLNFVIQNQSQFMGKPTSAHMEAAHRVLRYLKNFPGKGILLSRTLYFQLSAYSDSSRCLESIIKD